mgnify:CR=1 FL=1
MSQILEIKSKSIEDAITNAYKMQDGIYKLIYEYKGW